jgi:hypothetical protein
MSHVRVPAIQRVMQAFTDFAEAASRRSKQP